jgi:hypothetical protein
MAIACLRLFTLAPVRPLRSSPVFISCSALPTFRWLDLLYFRAMADLRASGRNLGQTPASSGSSILFLLPEPAHHRASARQPPAALQKPTSTFPPVL